MERIKQVLILPRFSIRHALKQMDTAGSKILFIVDEKNRILGVVTDGNIRRWILNGGALNERISKVMTREPILLQEGFQISAAKDLLVNNGIECIPIVDDKKRVISAVWWTDLFRKKIVTRKEIDLPVVIMAGGTGSRLAPYTNILPKPLVPIGDKPIIELIIDRFVEYACKEFYLSVNYKSSIIKAYFHDIQHAYRIHYIQEDQPLGTAGSLHLMKDKIDSTFFVSNCDILIEADFADVLDFHRANKNVLTMIGSMKHYTIPYGVCKVGRNGALNTIEEKPEYDFLVNTGMYILEPDVIGAIPKNKVFHLTDLITTLKARKQKVGVYPVSEKSWLDMGQFEELKETLKRFGA